MGNYMFAITRVLVTGAAIFAHCGRRLIGESEVTEWRGSNRGHGLKPTATECSGHFVRSDIYTPHDRWTDDNGRFGAVHDFL